MHLEKKFLSEHLFFLGSWATSETESHKKDKAAFCRGVDEEVAARQQGGRCAAVGLIRTGKRFLFKRREQGKNSARKVFFLSPSLETADSFS